MVDLENKLLDEAIEQSQRQHWDDKLINNICKNKGITREAFFIIFQDGLISLTKHFFKRVDNFMYQEASDELHTLPIHVQVSKLLTARFDYMNEQKHVVLKILSMPTNIKFQMSHVFETADNIWKSVKHESKGFDYYTRRIMLAVVYKNCLIQFKKDNHKDDIFEYMTKQLQCIGKITKFKRRFFS